MIGSKSRLLFCLEWLAFLSLLCAENWPAWRGPRGDGTSHETNIPFHWSATANVAWKTELPGSGHASPVVWGNRLFTVAALAETEERQSSTSQAQCRMQRCDPNME